MTLDRDKRLGLDGFEDEHHGWKNAAEDDDEEQQISFAKVVRIQSLRRDATHPVMESFAVAELANQHHNDNHGNNNDINDDDDEADVEAPLVVHSELRHIPSLEAWRSSYQPLHQRPSFICVTVLKPTPDYHVGIALEDDPSTRSVRIASIDALGLFAKTPLEKGDELISVNQTYCRHDHDAASCACLLETSPTVVQLVARHPHGHPFWVSTTVTKSTPQSSVGIGFRKHGNTLRVSSILNDGLFSTSLVNVGDEIVAIEGNYCHALQSSQAAQLVADCKTTVTVVTRPALEAAAVLALGGGHPNDVLLGSLHTQRIDEHDETLSKTTSPPRWHGWIAPCGFLVAVAALISFLVTVWS